MVIRGGYGEYIYPVPVRNSIRYLTADYPFTASYSQSYTSASQAPDGLPNYLLRSPQTVIAGLNSQNVVNTNSVNALLPGITLGETLNSKYPPAHVREANFTIEQPLRDGSVFRVTYVFTHGYNLDQNYQYNNAPSTYVWETATGTTPPTGTYASTATRPYDQTVWGGNVISMKTGWSNDSALQLNYQRPFKNGFGYQIFYVYSRAFRVGGNTFRDNMLYPAANFAPGVLPAGMDTGTILNPSQALNRYENYKVDTAIPMHHVTFNGIAELPVGKGKRFLGNADKFLNALVGGYQLAFVGQVVSQSFQVASANWGATSQVQNYGSSVPINDCRSGVCHPRLSVVQRIHLADRDRRRQERDFGYPRQLHAVSRAHQQYARHAEFRQQQCDRHAQERHSGSRPPTHPDRPAPTRSRRPSCSGPFNYITDMSLYKIFSLTERVKLRVNVDAFNSFNIQGRVNPNTTDGIESLQTSYWTPRQIQFTARLSF